MILTSKPWGTPCDNCDCNFSSQCPRVSLIATAFGVPASANLHQQESHLCSATICVTANARNMVRCTPNLAKSATGSLRAVAGMIVSRVSSKERGETFLQSPVLDSQHLPGASHERCRIDRDQNIPYD
jgi:hypothetical protein